MREKSRLRAALLGLLAGALAVATASAEDPPAAANGADPTDREKAIESVIEANTDEVRALLKESADFLAAQPKFAFKAHVGFDVLQANGQKLAFGATRDVTLRRPDRVRIEAQQRTGDRRTLYFDGEQIAVDLPDENAYVAVKKPGTLDAAIAYLVDDLGTPAPLHEFLSSNFYDGVKDAIRSGFYVDEETIGGRTCHHLAFRTDGVDAQIWIEDGDRPLPCSVVITYKLEEASPQFWANFHDWDLSPKTPDEIFVYEPPAGAEKLSIQTAVQEIRDELESP